MGEYADDIIDQIIDWEPSFSSRPPKRTNKENLKTWTDTDGNVRKYSEMTTSHLINIINYLENNKYGMSKSDWFRVKYIENELENRAEERDYD